MAASRSRRQDSTVLFIGLIGILCVGVFFASKRFFRSEVGDTSSATEAEETKDAESTDLAFITANDAWARSDRDRNIVFIDIRPAGDFEQLHVPRSRPIDFSALAGYEPEDGKTTVVISAASQSGLLPEADKILKRSGGPYLFLAGGFEAWTQSGRPTISIGNPGSFLDQSKVTYLKLGEIKTFLESNQDAVFLDVQTDAEYRASHVSRAIHIPLADLEQRAQELPRSKMIIIYGKSGGDAFRAGVRLTDLNLFMTRVIDATPADLEKSGIAFER